MWCRWSSSSAASQQSADLTGCWCESEKSLDPHECSALRRLLWRPRTDPSPAQSSSTQRWEHTQGPWHWWVLQSLLFRQMLVCPLSSTVMNSTCSDFHYGTALHIAASNLCLGAVKCLLEHGANPTVRVRPLQTYDSPAKWQMVSAKALSICDNKERK